MPVRYDKPTGKYRIGHGRPIYKTKSTAERAFRGYIAKKYREKYGHRYPSK